MFSNKTIFFGVALIIVLGLVVWGVWPRNQANDQAPEKNNGTLVGGDRDAHGCIPSAGYSWCDKKNSCIRPWEEYCTAASPNKVVFKCDASKSIAATFYPSDDKFVDLKLSDDRNISLPRAISASGARYAKADESIVFWNKGDTAFITENNTATFSNCALNSK